MSHGEKLTLKAFWEAVEQRLTACSAEELRDILRAMAQETLPTERRAFLNTLQPKAATATRGQEVAGQEELLADISDLSDELQAEMERAEAWEERYGWDEDDEEDSLGPYAEFVEPLTALFDRAEVAFDYGDVTLARAAYHQLFEVVALEDDYGRGVRAEDLPDVEADEARARYLRAVYDTEALAHRPLALFEQMQLTLSWLPRPRPMLDDIIQISPKPLPDSEQFFLDWIAFLRSQPGSDADAWLREAIRLSQGTPGLAALARAEGTQRPHAYVDWCAALEREGRHQEALAAAQEALRTLPPTLPIRAAVADFLCASATQLHDMEALQAGRWEAFAAQPTLARLLDMWEADLPGPERTRRMHQAAQHLQSVLTHLPRQQALEAWEDDLERPAWPDTSVLAHAYLLAGDWQAAHQLAVDEQVLGWSSRSSAQGLMVSCVLVRLSGRLPGSLPPNLAQLWQWGLQDSAGFASWHGGESAETGLLSRLQRAYVECLPLASLPDDKQAEMLAWCLDVTKRRVNAIVSNQHRGSYNRAAVLLAACAETLRLRGNDREAQALLDESRQRFPRHRAFQTEIKTAVQRMEHDLG
jgi:tetratricopeptide (TPR) repeat protein